MHCILTFGTFAFIATAASCQTPQNASPDCHDSPAVSSLTLNGGTNTVSRFSPPAGFKRADPDSGSFAFFLGHFPLKPDGTAVHYHNGDIKSHAYHAAVLDLSTGEENLQQCADAVMRLWAEYFYSQKAYNKMHFNFTNGFRCGFDQWSRGCRVKVQGNQTSWVCGQAPSTDRSAFQAWMNQVFMFAGTLSLEKEMQAVAAKDLRIGDVWIKGGSPGHAVIVMDMCTDSSGNKLFMLAQSYMPAQDMHILQNIHEPGISPWFRLPAQGEELYTPEWTFTSNQLRRFNP